VLRIIWRQLRGRAWRSAALLAGVLVATTGFIVLTGATSTSRLQVTGDVERNTRAAYDILVRPKGSRIALETDRRLVRPNYLSGLYGGITNAQYDEVKRVSGVDIAAPIAMLGYATTAIETPLDITDAVDRRLDRQVIRVDLTFLAERGLSTAPGKPRYVYVTKHPLIYPVIGAGFTNRAVPYTDGRSYPDDECGTVPIREVMPDRRTEPICDLATYLSGSGRLSNTSELDRWSITAVRLLPDGRFQSGFPVSAGDDVPAPTERLVFEAQLSVPLLLAAIDPSAENRLVGLDRAVTRGRPLAADEGPHEIPGGTIVNRAFPVLSTSRPYMDGAVHASYRRLVPSKVAGLPQTELAEELDKAAGVPVGEGRSDLSDGHQIDANGPLAELVQAGPTAYDELPDGTLRARTFPAKPKVPDVERVGNPLAQPWLADDLAFRPLLDVPLERAQDTVYRYWTSVGSFDPEKLTGFSELSKLPLETYEPPSAEGADEQSRQVLGGQPLEPSGNPGGYLTPPPLLLTNLASVPGILADGKSPQRTAPISAIRVKVSDVDGYSKRSAEQVRLVAERIAAVTGLDVDITLGSSPSAQTVELAPGKFGRPALRLSEKWSALGVASVIVQAVDRKSVVLFLLVLVVCALFLGNAVSAAVRARTPELAVLACLGWPSRRIALLILGEVAALGLGAGVLSLALAVPVSAVLGIGIGWLHAAVAVPLALVLALAAGAVPALRAARAHPAAALRPAATRAGWIRRPRGVFGLALVNLARTPGRTALGAAALAIGVAALTLVAAAAYTFRGAIVGSLLGDSVALSVRGADAAAVVATVLLGAAAVADVLYLNIRDRAAELAALQAIGWTDNALARLVAYEGAALGVLGAVTGSALGLAGAAWLAGEVTGALVLVAAGTAGGGVLATVLAAGVPAALLRRLPTAPLLAEE
jgi:putative ABC transport system permease protein